MGCFFVNYVYHISICFLVNINCTLINNWFFINVKETLMIVLIRDILFVNFVMSDFSTLRLCFSISKMNIFGVTFVKLMANKTITLIILNYEYISVKLIFYVQRDPVVMKSSHLCFVLNWIYKSVVTYPCNDLCFFLFLRLTKLKYMLKG